MKATPANTKTSPAASPAVGSAWSAMGINQNLVVKIRPVTESSAEGEPTKKTYAVDTTQPIVESLFEDADFAVESQYSTPFEASNPEGRLPNLMGLIQSGQVTAAYSTLFAAVADPTGIASGVADLLAPVGDFLGLDNVLGEADAKFQSLVGRSNFTKLNSRQIYTSSSSVRITGSLIFSAWRDARAEVEDALTLLQFWASPVKLSSDSLLVGGLKDGFSDAMFPSIIPPLLQLQYGGKTYSPMVMENVSAPITAPMNKNGDRITIKVPITLLSLNAWDGQNILDMRR